MHTTLHTLTVLILLLASPPLSAAGLLSGSVAVDSSYRTYDLTAADMNLDGIPDLVSLDDIENRIQVQLGTGGGGFADSLNAPLGYNALSLAVGDLNGDSIPDVAVTLDFHEELSILLGNGDGTLQPPVNYPVTTRCTKVVIGDLDGDGDQDLAACDRIVDLISTLLGDGAGGFVTGPTTAMVEPVSLALGDFDSDGILDLAVGNYYENLVTLVFGTGDGAFTNPATWALPEAIWGVTAGDFDQDGNLDLAAVSGGNYDDGLLTVLHGDGAGNLIEHQSLTGTLYRYAGTLADMNGDPYPDLVVHVRSEAAIHVLIGDGAGGFSTPVVFGTVANPQTRTAADFDGDGLTDVIVGSYYEPVLALSFGAGGGNLHASRHSPAIDTPVQLAVDDLTGDGIPDLALASASRDRIETLRGQGDGTFVQVTEIDSHDNIYGITIGDLNGDGYGDLALATLSANRLVTHFGQGNGHFSGPTYYHVGQRVNAVQLIDLNIDGHLDAALACGVDGGSPGTVVTYFGDGDGGLTEDQSYAVGAFPRDIQAADLNGDGWPDLVTCSKEDGVFSTLINAGDGSLGSAIASGAPGTPVMVSVTDLNGDGHPDAAVTHDDDGQVSIHLGDGSGSFTESDRLDVVQAPSSIVATDLDGDLLPELAVAGLDHSMLQVVRNLGAGQFAGAGTYITGNTPNDIAAADFDQDGRTDLVTANWWGASVTMFAGRPKAPPVFFIAAGPGAGPDNPPLVRAFADNSLIVPYAQWEAYGAEGFGVNVAAADLDGQPGAELLTGAGPGEVYGPHARGFDTYGTPLPGLSFLAYGTHRFGVNVAGGDIDGDGYAEIVTGAGPGQVFGPHVRAWNWDGGGTPQAIPGLSWLAYGTPKWGVNVACGDLDGDGLDEIVTGAGPGAVYGPHVRGWSTAGSVYAALGGVSFLAYGTNRYGVNVACGDVDGDGIDEIVTGAGPGLVFGPHVRGWNWDGVESVSAIAGINFFAYGEGLFGVNVSCGDLDDDGIDEILTGPGPDETAAARVRGWNFDGSALTAMAGIDFFAFDEASSTHGVKTAAGRF